MTFGKLWHSPPPISKTERREPPLTGKSSVQPPEFYIQTAFPRRNRIRTWNHASDAYEKLNPYEGPDGIGCPCQYRSMETSLHYPEGRATSHYREFPVGIQLREHFLCLWTQSISGTGEYLHRVLPDGCVDIVFINNQAPRIVGPWTRSFIVPIQAGDQIVGARFHPGRADCLLGSCLSDLLNASVPLDCVVKKQFMTQLAPALDREPDITKLSALEAALTRLMPSAGPFDSLVRHAVDWIHRHPEEGVQQLSGCLGVSSRQVQRRFVAAVGYGPKTLQSILRFQRLLHLASAAPVARGLAHVAVDAGYADQAHMTREVHRLSGLTPAKLLRSAPCTLQMSDLFKTPGPELTNLSKCSRSLLH
jgi:AraC-like DNA-binding protein